MFCVIFLAIFVPERDDMTSLYMILYPKGTNREHMNIGEYIQTKRKLHGLTQVELAERSGVGVRFVRELERGKPTVQLDKVNQVLALFGEELSPTKIKIS